ncbi:MAG: flagellar hook-length control protein FliK [candidate division Zixibacteria bacterium]|nr:flagellar hook-length control protein FliK [candidate division Zixibacteria bacterium]
MADNEAFASALELLLTGMPAATPGGDSPNTTDLATLLLMGQTATPQTGSHATPVPALAIPTPVSDGSKTGLPMPTDATAIATLMALMPLMPQPSGVVATDPQTETTLTAVPVNSLLELPAANTLPVNPNTPTGAVSIIDPALLAATGPVQFTLPSLNLPTQTLPQIPVAATAIGSTSDPLVSQMEREFLPVPLPFQPHYLIVTDQQSEPSAEPSGQGSALVTKAGDSQPSLDIAPQTQIPQGNVAAKQAGGTPFITPAQIELNQSVTPGVASATVPTKADVATPQIPSQKAAIAHNADQTLSTKILNPANFGNGSTEMRTLTGKASELGIQSLSVRLGNENSKSAERLRALSSLDDSALVRTMAKGSTPIMQPAQPWLRDRDGDSTAITEQPARKKSDPHPQVESGRPFEPVTKSNTQAQDTSVRPASVTREVVIERTESASAPRFIVDEPKPIRVPGQITVRMEPSNLGPLTIDLQSGTDGIIARLRFGSEAVRSTVERDITQLHRALSDAGIRVERLDIVGVSPANERSGVSSHTPPDHQAPQRDTQSQGRHNQPGDRPTYNQRERSHRQAPAWPSAPQSPWVAMNKMASSLNLVA